MTNMPLFSFLHCADLHLDSPFEGLRGVAPEIGRFLWDATFQAYARVIALAVEHRVDFILIAGDVYDGADRSLRAQLRFRDGLLQAREAGIQVFVAHGNHDPLNGWEAKLQLPDNVQRFGGDQVEHLDFRRGAEVLARVYGISFPVREVTDNLATRFPRPSAGVFNIGVLHCNVGGLNADHYAPCSLGDLAGVGMDYWALGHVHTPRILREERPWVVYPGNTQGRSVRECGPRGCYLVRVDDRGGVDLDFLSTDMVRWFTQEVDVSQLATLDDLLAELSRLKEEIRSRGNGRGAVLRLALTGRSELHSRLQPLDLDRDLLATLRDEEAGRSDFVWLESLVDRTRPTLNLEERRQVQDFVGDFLRAGDSLRRDDAPGVRLREILTARPEHRTLAAALETLADDDLLGLLEEAETLGLDFLLPDDGQSCA